MQGGLPNSTLMPTTASEYLEIIDDLTAQSQKLRKELEQYRARTWGISQWDVFFEVEMCGLPIARWRELEMMLEDVSTSLGCTNDTSLLIRSESRVSMGFNLNVSRHIKEPET